MLHLAGIGQRMLADHVAESDGLALRVAVLPATHWPPMSFECAAGDPGVEIAAHASHCAGGCVKNGA